MCVIIAAEFEIWHGSVNCRDIYFTTSNVEKPRTIPGSKIFSLKLCTILREAFQQPYPFIQS